MADKITTFLILHGDDGIGLDEALAKLRAQMDMGPNGDLNTSEFDGEQASVPEVLNAVSSYPFLAEKRLVIVKGMLSWLTRKGAGETGKKGIAELQERLPQLPDYSRLIFIERDSLSDNHAILKLANAEARGHARAFIVPKDTTDWIIKRAREYDMQIEPQAAAALASVTPGDLRRADNELVKLMYYVDGQRAITEADVALLTPYRPEAKVFDMVDALVAGNSKQAMIILHRSLDEDPRDEGFGLFALIVTQFRRLLLAREHLQNGGAPRDLGSVLGVQPWLGDKIAKQSRKFTLAQLDQIYHTLLDYDVKMKTGRIEPRLALDLVVAGLAGN